MLTEELNRDNSLHSSVYYKPTDSHSYLTCASYHHKSCKRFMPYSQILRLCRLCQDDLDFQYECARMRDFFSACGYPIDTLEVAWNRVSKICRAESLLPKASTSFERTILIITYNPQSVVAQRIIFQNLDILKADPKACKVFYEPPLVVFQKATKKKKKNMRDLLLRSRVKLRATWVLAPGIGPGARRRFVSQFS